MTDWGQQAETQYAALPGYANMRLRELVPLLEPYTRVTDFYGQLICRITLILGQASPRSKLDAMTRDLAADIFDFLYEARALILRGMLHVAYPLARRGFESLCLAVASNMDDSLATKWQSGDEVKYYQIRQILADHPMGESDAALKETYGFFSQATHPRRGRVAERHLGQGNSFVLGAIGRPELVLLADYCIKTLNLWFWFGAFLRFTYFYLLAYRDPSFAIAYQEAAESAREATKWLGEQYNGLLGEYE